MWKARGTGRKNRRGKERERGGGREGGGGRERVNPAQPTLSHTRSGKQRPHKPTPVTRQERGLGGRQRVNPAQPALSHTGSGKQRPHNLFVGWLLNVPATCECISGTDLLRQLYMLPH